MKLFWEKGLNKLEMTTNLLTLIANETNEINRKLDQYQASVDNIKNIEDKIKNDINNNQHRLILEQSNEFNEMIGKMKNISKSQSYQHGL